MVLTNQMLYRFDPASQQLDRLTQVAAQGAQVREKEIELAIARSPGVLFGGGADDSPVLVVAESIPGRRMADIVALDSAGRLVLVECKRDWATRATVSQLLDYASDYHANPLDRLEKDWSSSGRAGRDGTPLLDAFRQFAEDPTFPGESLGKEHVLTVVAAAPDDGFLKIADYLRDKGVEVHFAEVHLYIRSNGELFLEVDPIQVGGGGIAQADSSLDVPQAWMINTDEKHTPGAWRAFLSQGVAAIWGYETGPATLQQGARDGDAIYAYLNGQGIIAAGVITDSEVRRASSETSVFPNCKDGNEWHIQVRWHTTPDTAESLANSQVRDKTNTGLPVRSTFCRLWNARVRQLLSQQFAPPANKD